jgi:hypothetical protein
LILRLKYLLFYFLFINDGYTIYGQKPVGKFTADSTYLGEITSYTFVYKHSAALEVLFPDINYNYYPFEFVEKLYFPTKTSNGISVDSAVYKLRTFNINKVQPLALPIFLLKNGDSTQVFANKDSIYLHEEITSNASNLKLKDNSSFLPMKIKPNYILIFGQLALLLIVAFIWWLFFGKTIRKQYKLLTIYRRHNEFKKTFTRYTKNISKSNIEKTLDTWKNYMGKLRNESFNTMTTPEIVKSIPYENLNEALRTIDSSIYGNNISDNISEAVNVLNELADLQYESRKKEII